MAGARPQAIRRPGKSVASPNAYRTVAGAMAPLDALFCEGSLNVQFFSWDRNVRERECVLEVRVSLCWSACASFCQKPSKGFASRLPLYVPDRPEFILGKEIAHTHTRPRFVVVIGFVSFKFSNFRQKYCQVVFSHANKKGASRSSRGPLPPLSPPGISCSVWFHLCSVLSGCMLTTTGGYLILSIYLSYLSMDGAVRMDARRGDSRRAGPPTFAGCACCRHSRS